MGAKINYVMGSGQDRLMMPLVLVEFEPIGRFSHLGEDLGAGDGRGVYDHALLINAEGVVLGVGDVLSAFCEFLNLHDLSDFNNFYNFRFLFRFHCCDPSFFWAHNPYTTFGHILAIYYLNYGLLTLTN